MANDTKLDGVRAEVMARINRNERNIKLGFFAAMMIEALFLVTFLLLMDRGNRTHVLLLIASVGSYSIVVFGLITLGAYVNRGVLRVLKAVELLDR